MRPCVGENQVFVERNYYKSYQILCHHNLNVIVVREDRGFTSFRSNYFHMFIKR